MILLQCCYKDSNGINVSCERHESIREFEGEIPNWENRQNEADDREIGNLVYETDILPESTAPIADWDYFLSISYVDPNERA